MNEELRELRQAGWDRIHRGLVEYQNENYGSEDYPLMIWGAVLPDVQRKLEDEGYEVVWLNDYWEVELFYGNGHYYSNYSQVDIFEPGITPDIIDACVKARSLNEALKVAAEIIYDNIIDNMEPFHDIVMDYYEEMPSLI